MTACGGGRRPRPEDRHHGTARGVGDSLLMTMIPTIMGSIAAPAIEGQPRGSRHLVRAHPGHLLGPHARPRVRLQAGVKASPTSARSFPTSLPPPPCSASPWSAASSPRSSASPARLASASATSQWRFSRCLNQSLPAMIPAAITGSAYYLLTKEEREHDGPHPRGDRPRDGRLRLCILA